MNNNKPSCISCEFKGFWICKNPLSKTTLIINKTDKPPRGCPLVDTWNRKRKENNKEGNQMAIEK